VIISAPPTAIQERWKPCRNVVMCDDEWGGTWQYELPKQRRLVGPHGAGRAQRVD
jgi:hypothetical protein